VGRIGRVMGMFDYFYCDYPLPGEVPPGVEFQTKCTPMQGCRAYRLTVDGALELQEFEMEHCGDPDTPPEKRFLEMRRVNERWVPVTWTGSIFFYGQYRGWVEFVVLIQRGKMVGEIEVVDWQETNPEPEEA